MRSPRSAMVGVVAGGALTFTAVLTATPASATAPTDCAAAVATQTTARGDAQRLDALRDGAQRKLTTASDALAAAKGKQSKDAATLSAALKLQASDTKAVTDAQAADLAEDNAVVTPPAVKPPEPDTQDNALAAAVAALNADGPKVTAAQGAFDADTPAVATASSDETAANGVYQRALRDATTADTALATANSDVNRLCGAGAPPSTVVVTPPAAQSPAPVYRVIDGRKCKWVNDTWVPVVAAPCPDCATTPPPVLITAPAPPNTVSITPPAPSGGSFSQLGAGNVPSGSVPTGDGSLASVVGPIPDPDRDRLTVLVTLDLGDLLDIDRDRAPDSRLNTSAVIVVGRS